MAIRTASFRFLTGITMVCAFTVVFPSSVFVKNACNYFLFLKCLVLLSSFHCSLEEIKLKGKNKMELLSALFIISV